MFMCIVQCTYTVHEYAVSESLFRRHILDRREIIGHITWNHYYLMKVETVMLKTHIEHKILFWINEWVSL